MSRSFLALVAIAVQLILMTLVLFSPSWESLVLWAIGTLTNMACFLIYLKKAEKPKKWIEAYDCECCGRTFTELDEEEATLNGYSYHPAHELCPMCYREEKSDA